MEHWNRTLEQNAGIESWNGTLEGTLEQNAKTRSTQYWLRKRKELHISVKQMPLNSLIVVPSYGTVKFSWISLSNGQEKINQLMDKYIAFITMPVIFYNKPRIRVSTKSFLKSSDFEYSQFLKSFLGVRSSITILTFFNDSNSRKFFCTFIFQKILLNLNI